MQRTRSSCSKRLAVAGAVTASLVFSAKAAQTDSMLVYFGTYTGAKSQGIYVSRFDSTSGRLTAPELAAETRNPTFLALHPSQRFLYAAGEFGDFEGRRSGAVSAYRIDATSGKLTLLNQKPSGGTGPCHLSVDRTGRCVLAANYGSGSVAALPLSPEGNLGDGGTVLQHAGSSVNKQRQAGPHGHFIMPDPANRFALACDLGLDKVLVYRLDAERSQLTPNDPPSAATTAGAGPRHLAFSPNGRFAYVINELDATLTLFTYDAGRGALTPVESVSTLPEGFTGPKSCAEVQVHPSGKFVYGSNRGHDSIVIFAANPESGRLTLVGHEPSGGKTPRHFTLDPAGQWLLAENQDSHNVVVFKVEAQTGRLKATDQRLELGSPVCAVFVQNR